MQQIVVIFAMIFIGLGCNKIGWLPSTSSKSLSKLVLNVSCPSTILYTMTQQTVTEDRILAIIQILSLVAFITFITAVVSIKVMKYLKVPEKDRGICAAQLAYTNNGFMGYPIALTIFGENGLFMMIIANTILNISIYNFGRMLVQYGNGSKLTKKEIATSFISVPSMAAIIGIVLFLTNFRFPTILQDLLSYLGNTTVPLAMIVIGIQLGGSKIKDVIGSRLLYGLSAAKLLIFPAAVYLFLMCINRTGLMEISADVIYIITLNFALPSAVVPVMLAEQYDGNAKLGAEVVFINTLFSMGTITVFALLATSGVI